jgi:hypothetical protein
LKSNNCNALSPARQGLTRLPRPLGQGDVLAGPVSVARVRPRTSKGITAFRGRTHKSYLFTDLTAASAVLALPHFDLSGLHVGAWFPKGLARTLSHCFDSNDPPLSARCDGSTLLKLATGLAKHPSRMLRRPLYQVVSPTPRELSSSRLCPTVGDFPTKIKVLD